MKKVLLRGGAALLAMGLTACQQTSEETVAVGQSVSALDPCVPVTIDLSVVVHDQATIGAADFSFQRTIAAIRNTSGGAATTNAALADTIRTGLVTNPFTQPVSGLPIPANLRNAENTQITGAGLLTQMQPIALFNRFDLAPADGSNCGEYRIVYGRYPNSTLSRYLLIFEAKLPNPTPGLGIEGCRPVAQFWHDLADSALTPAQRGALLADFYYVGLAGFSAVVTHSNYGVPLGQVRANMFLMQPWQLREWKTSFNGSGQPVFAPETDKDNPLAQFYNEASGNPNPPLFASEQAAFLADFTAGRMDNLTKPETDALDAGVAPPTGCDLVNAVGAGFLNRFNEFQSDSQGTQDEPGVLASTNFRNAVTAAIAPGVTLTQQHVLNRAGAMTCGGCHEFSEGDAIGPGTTWPGPAAGGFVHVREQGAAPPAITPLSPALNSCFLPGRRSIMESFLCVPDGGVPDSGPADTGPADSGANADGGVPPDAGPQGCGPYLPPCGAYEYCEFGPYNICGANGPGVCTPRPTSCGYGSDVCGCDGQTYPSECHANQAGTDVASAGACACNIPVPRGCCAQDSDCAKVTGGECVGESCQTGQAGVCVPKPGKGQCYEDNDCPAGEFCKDEVVCPCGASCLVPDRAGYCTAKGTGGVVTVDKAKAALLQSSNTASRQQALADFEAAVRAEREREAAQPGAFVPTRRTH